MTADSAAKHAAEIKDTEIGPIPADWQVVPISAVVTFARKPRDLELSGYPTIPFVPMDLIPVDRIFVDRHIPKKPAEIRSGTYFERGDVLLAKITPSFENGKQGIPDEIPAPFGYATTEVYPLRPRPGILDRMFLFHYLRTSEFRAEVAGKMEGTTGRQRVPKSVIENHPIPLPPLSEQRRIARVLGAIQRAIAAQDELITPARELKRALMRRLFTYGPGREPAATTLTEIGEIPEQWRVVRLDSVAELASGGTPSKKRPEWWQGAIPWASPKDLKTLRLSDTQDHITSEALDAGSRMVPSGTILIVIRGMILAKDLPVVLTQVPMAFNQDIKAILPSEHVDGEYLLYALCSHHRDSLWREIGTSAHGTRRIGTSALEAFSLPLPESPEQREIARSLGAADRKIAAEQECKAALQALFKSMLHQLMTGRIRLNRPDLANWDTTAPAPAHDGFAQSFT
jgi:type I restriction enzyme S subunit